MLNFYVIVNDWTGCSVKTLNLIRVFVLIAGIRHHGNRKSLQEISKS